MKEKEIKKKEKGRVVRERSQLKVIIRVPCVKHKHKKEICGPAWR